MIEQGDIIRATAELAAGNNQQIENVFYFRNDGLGGVVDSLVNDDLGQFLDDLYDNIVGWMSPGCSFVALHYHNITQNVTLPSYAWPTQTAGTAGTVGLPAGVAALVTLPTGILKVRGRKYFGQLAEGANIGDQWDTGLLTDLATVGASLVGSFVGAVSANFWLPGVIDQHGDYWAFEQAVASAIPAYQRRRRLGTGR